MPGISVSYRQRAITPKVVRHSIPEASRTEEQNCTKLRSGSGQLSFANTQRDFHCRLPEKYWNLTLPHKLPPRKEMLPIGSLPMLGFMEQTAANAITKSLTAVGNFKPKYPFLTSSKSALIYVAYHLKGKIFFTIHPTGAVYHYLVDCSDPAYPNCYSVNVTLHRDKWISQECNAYPLHSSRNIYFPY